MNEFLSKLSSYNIFNYLLPGVVFAVAADTFTNYALVQSDLVIGVFVYYFIGLAISRFGSLVLEPLLRKLSFLHFADYAEFVAASEADPKIELLSEINNTYRTLCSAVLLVGLLRLYQAIEVCLPGLQDWTDTILLVLLVVMFLFSYRKQTEYITKRVKVGRKSK